MHPLIDAWRRFQGGPPLVLAGDEAVLEHPERIAPFHSWDAYIADPCFGRPATPELHLGLLSMPFVGDLATAKVFLLMLNPGLAPSDYFGEYTVPSYREHLLRNLRQEPGSSFLFLEPKYSWHGGYLYWQGKLRQLIVEMAKRRSIEFGAARRFLQKRLATIELFPCHSRNMKFPAQVLSSLASVTLVKSFVQDQLVPRAQAGQCLIVAMRAVAEWDLPEHRNIIRFSPAEARNAHLAPKRLNQILNFLQDGAEAAKPRRRVAQKPKSMSGLAATAHIGGAIASLIAMGFLTALLGRWGLAQVWKRRLQAAAVEHGVSLERLECDESFGSALTKLLAKRASPELLRNRLADLCGAVRTVWLTVGGLLQLAILAGVLWFTVFESATNAPMAWLAVVALVFFWACSVALSYACLLVTGHIPGEPKLARKALLAHLAGQDARREVVDL